MKHITIIILLSTCILPACKKSKSTTPAPVIARGMFANMNGVAWTGENISNVSYTGGGSDYVEFSGYDTISGRGIDFKINNFTKLGTFAIPQANDTALYSADFGAFITYTVATTGQISIEGYTDSSIEGTFNFVAGGITVSSGTFNVNYQ